MDNLRTLALWVFVLPVVFTWQIMIWAWIWHCEVNEFQIKAAQLCVAVRNRPLNGTTAMSENQSTIMMTYDFHVEDAPDVRLFQPEEAVSSKAGINFTAGGCTFSVRKDSSEETTARPQKNYHATRDRRAPTIYDTIFGKGRGAEMDLVNFSVHSCARLYQKSNSSFMPCTVSLHYEPDDIPIPEASSVCLIIETNFAKKFFSVILPIVYVFAVYTFIMVKFSRNTVYLGCTHYNRVNSSVDIP